MPLSSIYRIFIVAFAAMILIFLASNPLKATDFHTKNDEGYYYKYAYSEVLHGKGILKRLISWYATSDEARIHPAPLRIGYILMSAFLFKACGFPSFYILVFVSTLSFFIFLYICFNYVRIYFDVDTALLTFLFLSSSPLMLGLSRRALIDSSANLLWGLAVWLFLDVLTRPKRSSYVFFLITLIAAISFKEVSLILIPFFMLAGWMGKRNGSAVNAFQIWGVFIFPAVFIFLFYGWIFGGAGFFQAAISAISKTHFSSNYPNAYAIDYCSGPWFRYLVDFLLLIPLETLLFIAYAGYLCTQKGALDFKRKYLLAYFVYVYGALSFLAHSKVVRFVVNLEMVIALFAVLMMIELSKGSGEQKRRIFLFYGCFGIFLYNWFSFMDLIYKPTLLDPISYYLLVFRHFIPW